MTTADRKVDYVKLSDGRKVAVTQGNWRSLITDSKNAKDRAKIFEAVFNYYQDNKNTLASIYQLIYQMDYARVKARNFNSILESHLFANNIPTSVYTNLVEVASTKNKGLKKYIKLRKKHLKLKSHKTYDRFLSLAHSDKKYPYEEAKKLFFASIDHLPNHFKEKAHELFHVLEFSQNYFVSSFLKPYFLLNLSTLPAAWTNLCLPV